MDNPVREAVKIAVFWAFWMIVAVALAPRIVGVVLALVIFLGVMVWATKPTLRPYYREADRAGAPDREPSTDDQ
jgi:fatty acid desaturase